MGMNFVPRVRYIDVGSLRPDMFVTDGKLARMALIPGLSLICNAQEEVGKYRIIFFLRV